MSDVIDDAITIWWCHHNNWWCHVHILRSFAEKTVTLENHMFQIKISLLKIYFKNIRIIKKNYKKYVIVPSYLKWWNYPEKSKFLGYKEVRTDYTIYSQIWINKILILRKKQKWKVVQRSKLKCKLNSYNSWIVKLKEVTQLRTDYLYLCIFC